MVNEKAKILVFVSRTILNSQELFESRIITLEEKSIFFRKKGRCNKCPL